MIGLTLLPILLSGLAVLASPTTQITSSPVTLPFARRMNVTGAHDILRMDQARAKSLRSKSHDAKSVSGGTERDVLRSAVGAAFGVPSTSQGVDYVVQVQVGTPPKTYNMLVDTGSSNTWICCEMDYFPSPTSFDTGNSVYVEYGSGVMLGEQYLDVVHIAPGLSITNQSIGVALIAIGFDDVDGLLGIGPQVLTYGNLFPNATEFVPTVVDNLYDQGIIPKPFIGISFQPNNATQNQNMTITNGELSFGDVDASKYEGDVNYVPITKTLPAGYYVGINQTVTYGSDKTMVLNNTAGITDTGTTLLLLATDALATYQQLTGAVLDENVGLLKITPDQFSNLQSLFFTIGSETYEFTPNAQIWPRALNSAVGGDDSSIYLIVSDIGTPTGEGMDFINGMVWLERFYTVYDTLGSRFGVAKTAGTYATTN
ncbi:hypothetical protein EIP91_005385 [Steccherinum ochraceum]|uniref:Peptidase A1 domain-containing protein n=1 Tax=Steccherinum ochraceum TaxID=92696 RepID=A0A4R0RMB5_9APHY|nr:hypothetical protein EIP91_005385 [Steccherinum ochraceum]